jgi:hypothetical protein
MTLCVTTVDEDDRICWTDRKLKKSRTLGAIKRRKRSLNPDYVALGSKDSKNSKEFHKELFEVEDDLINFIRKEE